MSNPTFGNESQFNKPFNILPDAKPGSLGNPTIGQTGKDGQFNSPFNILPDFDYSRFNPTTQTNQFNNPIHDDEFMPITLPNPTQGNTSQFIDPFDILPNPSLLKFNPTIGQTQFVTNTAYGDVFTFNSIIPTPGFEDNPTNTTNLKDPITDNTIYKLSFTNTNLTEDGIVNLTAATVGGALGIPYASQIVSTLDTGQPTPYQTLPLDKLKPFPGVKYSDFRSRVSNVLKAVTDPPKLLTVRADGAAAAVRTFTAGAKPYRAIAYAAAAASPAGAYSIFNRDASGILGYGYGDHGNPNALRNDFTLGTQVQTRWIDKKKEWQGALKGLRQGAIDALLPFRGDKVNVIDFKRKQKYDQVYQWKDSLFGTDNFIGKALQNETFTQDFIKFFFTGPNLQNGLVDAQDDIMVFRAIITQLNDSFNANWTPVQFIGRADPNYHYTGYSRDLSLGFDVYATSRDELKFIWRKLNALAGYTTPTYPTDDIAMRAPWMRITIGDLFRQQPVVLNSLSYDYATDSSWEINIEDDPTNMQVPFKISVSCQFNMITDYLPQKNGSFFTLAKRFNGAARPEAGNDNWLSDFGSTARTGEAGYEGGLEVGTGT